MVSHNYEKRVKITTFFVLNVTFSPWFYFLTFSLIVLSDVSMENHKYEMKSHEIRKVKEILFIYYTMLIYLIMLTYYLIITTFKLGHNHDKTS